MRFCFLKIVAKAYRAQLFVIAVGMVALAVMATMSGQQWLLASPVVGMLIVLVIAPGRLLADRSAKRKSLARLWELSDIEVFLRAYDSIYFIACSESCADPTHKGRHIDEQERRYIASLPLGLQQAYRRRSDRFRVAAGLPPRFV